MANRECLFCSARFEAKRDRKLFCSDICRVRHNREEHLTCFYCGEMANTRDHVYPHSADTLSRKRLFRGKETVNACAECNSTLGDACANYIEERIMHLITRTEDKYQLNKHVPDWTDAELKGLGYTLRSHVARKVQIRQRAFNRVVHMRGVWRKVLFANVDDGSD